MARLSADLVLTSPRLWGEVEFQVPLDDPFDSLADNTGPRDRFEI
jgi:hypothetical protein